MTHRKNMARPRSNGEFTITKKILVPLEKVGKIIGKRGCMIREMQEKTGAKITISQENEGNSKIIFLRGNIIQISKADAAISNLIIDEPQPPPKSSENTITVEFSIPEDKSDLVVGKDGAKIREIQCETGVDINIGYWDSGVKVSLKGTKDGCDKAWDMIDNIINKVKQPQAGSAKVPSPMIKPVNKSNGSIFKVILNKLLLRQNTDIDENTNIDSTKEISMTPRSLIEEPQTKADSTTSTMWIEKAMCGLIIGSKGSKIREIQSESGANVKVNTNEMVQGKTLVCEITLSGDPIQTSKAREIIEHILSNKRKTRQQQKYHANYSIEIWVTERRCGFIIGKNHTTRNEIQRKTNTRIVVNSDVRNKEGKCLVRVFGEEDGCEQARQTIDMLGYTRIYGSLEGY